MVCNDTLAGNHQMEMVTANLKNPSVRVFENTHKLLEYLKTANLEEECIKMKEHVGKAAPGIGDFNKLIDEVQERPHKTKISVLVFGCGLLIVCLSMLN